MKSALRRLISVAAVAPLAVGVSDPPDSSVTSLTVAMGAGSYAYVTRGCDNKVIEKHQRRFRETGFTLNHDFPGPFELGVRATNLRRMPGYGDGTMIWNPYLALEGKNAGVNFGIIPRATPHNSFALDPDFKPGSVSGHLRFGSREQAYVSLHLSDDAPLVAVGGKFRAGLGIHFRPADVWLGVGAEPYDRSGFILRSTVRVSRYFDVSASGRLGTSEGLSENAGTIGATFKIPWAEVLHRRTPEEDDGNHSGG